MDRHLECHRTEAFVKAKPLTLQHAVWIHASDMKVAHCILLLKY